MCLTTFWQYSQILYNPKIISIEEFFYKIAKEITTTLCYVLKLFLFELLGLLLKNILYSQPSKWGTYLVLLN